MWRIKVDMEAAAKNSAATKIQDGRQDGGPKVVFANFRPLACIWAYDNARQLLCSIKLPFQWYVTLCSTTYTT